MPKSKNSKTMRITGGKLVRQRFVIPDLVEQNIVRPTPDRVREAVFSMLGDKIKNSLVLDLFAGSGSHGFEALSRGAAHVCFVEQNIKIYQVIKQNCENLALTEKIKLVLADALEFIISSDIKFDVIFVDPPYSLKPDAEFFVYLREHICDDGLVIFRCFKKDEPDFSDKFKIKKDRTYAGTRVFVLCPALTD